MADFCKQCSIKIFSEDYEDMKGLCTLEENENDLYARVLCEGCGYTVVDCDGRCASLFCEIHGEENKRLKNDYSKITDTKSNPSS